MTPQQLEGITESIIAEKERAAERKREDFVGIPKKDFLMELSQRIDDECSFVKVHLKLNSQDINAVANRRFFDEIGQKLLMGTAVIILALILLLKILPGMPLSVYYVLIATIAVILGGFIVIYRRKQLKFKREFAKTVPGGKLELGK
jgi:hypothetical protein